MLFVPVIPFTLSCSRARSCPFGQARASAVAYTVPAQRSASHGGCALGLDILHSHAHTT